jgi:protein-tyrosine phosphatase
MTPLFEKRITTSRLINLRDLGGTPIMGGGKVKPGLLLRSDDASIIDDVQAFELVEQGLTTVIDLRSPEEAEYTGRGALGAYPVDYYALPLTRHNAAPTQLADAIADGRPESLGRWYGDLLVSKAASLVAGLTTVAQAPGAVLFHCAAGKDRTGVFAAAVLSALEAHEDAIITDYAHSDVLMPEILARLSSLKPASPPSTVELNSVVLTAPSASMYSMLRTLEQEHGGIRAVLQRAGLDSSLTTAMTEKLVDPDN